MKFKFSKAVNLEEDFEACYEGKVKNDATRKGYNPNGKDKKRAELDRKRARNVKYARRTK